jgi:hypothetical protein
MSPSLFVASLIDALERYDKKPGIIGKIHGDKNEPRPARAEIKMLASIAILECHRLFSF